ncbi:unnamed protein product [Caretta caretta]
MNAFGSVAASRIPHLWETSLTLKAHTKTRPVLQGVYSLLVAETITQQFGNTIGKMGSGSRQHGDKSVNKELISIKNGRTEGNNQSTPKNEIL